MRLWPFTRSEVAELLFMSIDFGDLREATAAAAKLHAASQGNPFMVSELLKSLREQGIIVQDGGRWRMHAGMIPDRILLPGEIHDLLNDRMNSLGGAARTVASHLATLPPAVGIDVLRRRSGLRDGTFARALNGMVQREVAHWVDEETVNFVHDQLREAARASLGQPGYGPQIARAASTLRRTAMTLLTRFSVSGRSDTPQSYPAVAPDRLNPIEMPEEDDPAPTRSVAREAKAPGSRGRNGDRPDP